MNNPRGPMVPHEIRAILDRSRVFDSAANAMQTLARLLRMSAQRDYATIPVTKDEIERAVIEAENMIKITSIEIRKMKDEPHTD